MEELTTKREMVIVVIEQRRGGGSVMLACVEWGRREEGMMGCGRESVVQMVEGLGNNGGVKIWRRAGGVQERWPWRMHRGMAVTGR